MKQLIYWLNAEPEDTTILLQRDGVFPFLSWADLTRPPQPLITFRACAWLVVLACGLPVIFY
jgi:hypothetical protein